MNAYMNIQVRVLGAAAQARIKALQGQIAALQAQTAGANAAAAGGALGSSRQTQAMYKWGNALQWTGRQLQYNWTLPLALAGGAAVKWQLDNERAFTHVSKVYGDTAAAAEFFMKRNSALTQEMAENKAARIFAAELQALEEAFEAISSHYGVQQAQVLEVAGAWAAAGASGRDLAESVDLTMKAMILGNMDAAKATDALIAIQSQYSLNTRQLSLTLAELNAIENQTGIQMQGLIDGMSRSAGVAREAGIDVRHLGAMMAALVPATGSASQAGNALKTIISRLMSPTKEAAQVMEEFGVNTADSTWQSSTAMERLQIIANHMNNTLEKTGQATRQVADDGYKMSDSQKQIVATVLGSRWQLNKFLVLMRELGPAQSYYEKALDATSDRASVFQQMQKELNNVLSSSPKRLDSIWYSLQNGMADAVQPMIPYLIYLANEIKDAVLWFTNLDPALQKFILFAALSIALLGPFVRYLGSLATLVGVVGHAFRFAIPLLGGFLFGTTKMVDGVEKSRSGLVGWAKAAVALPFTLLKRGFIGIGDSIWRFYKMIGIVSVGTGLISGAWSVALITMQGNAKYTWRMIQATWAMGIVRLRSLIVSGALVPAFASMMRQMLMHVLLFAGLAQVALGRFFIGARTRSQAGFATLGATWAGGFAALRLIQYTWLTQSVERFRAWAFRVATIITLLPSMIAGALQTLWAVLMIPGGVSAVIQRSWAALTLRLTAIWAAFRTRMFVVHGSLMAGLAAMTSSIGARLVAVWAAVWGAVSGVAFAMMQRLRMLWAGTLIFMAMAPARILAAVGAAWGGIVAGARIAWFNLVVAIRLFGKQIIRAILGPWGIAISLVVGILYHFRDQIGQIWNNLVSYFSDSNNAVVQAIIDGWNMLPQGVANALTAVAQIVQQAALQIYEWFSYINPFARHSPSLVENVQSGLGAVRAEFAKMGSVGNDLRGAYSAINAFGQAVRSITGGAASFEAAQDRAKIKKFAPGALDEYDRLNRVLRTLQGSLSAMEGRVKAQEAAVARWQERLDAANEALERQQDRLDDLQAVASKYQERLDAANDRLSTFASTPIKGMGKMEDAIFRNEQAQKRLRLEMMKMGKDKSLDDRKRKIDEINGLIELMRGEQAELRAAGAGREILKTYDQEIAKLEKQRKGFDENSSQISKAEKELEKLQRRGEMLDLRKSLRFDGLTRQIEEAANQIEEMPFDKIMEGIRRSQNQSEKWTEKVREANAAVRRQQAVVDRLTASRDRLQDGLDAEQQKLDRLNEKYQQLESAIRDVESALSDTVSAADTLQRKLDDAKRKREEMKKAAEDAKKKKGAGAEEYVSPGLANFRAAAGGNFAEVGGAGIPQRKDWRSQVPDIRDFTNQLSKESASAFEGLDPFQPIRDAWGRFRTWVSEKWAGFKAWGRDFLNKIFMGVDFSSGIDAATGTLSPLLDTVKNIWGTIRRFAGALWDLFGPEIKGLFWNIVDGFVLVWEKIAPEIAKFKDLFAPIVDTIQDWWTIIKPIIVVWLLQLFARLKLIGSVLNGILGPAFRMIGEVIAAAIQVIRGVIRVIVGVFRVVGGIIAGVIKLLTGDFSGAMDSFGSAFKGVWDIIVGFFDIFKGTFDAIWHVLRGAVEIIAGAIWGLVKGIFGFFKWLWNVLVGHSIVPDIVDGIVKVFKGLAKIAKWIWQNVLKPIVNFFKSAWKDYIWPGIKAWWGGLTKAWTALKKAGKWIWTEVLKPVWEWFSDLWKKYVSPFLKDWWNNVKARWALLKKLGRWIWDNVLKPVWEWFRDIWSKYVGPALKDWWNNVKARWALLKRLGRWVWDNILKPVWNWFRDLWSKHVKPALGDWWNNLKSVWANLKTAGKWVWDNVLKPIYDKFKEAWRKIKSWLTNAKDFIFNPIKSVINSVIGAVNKMIGGLNKISKVLPGIDWSISLIPKLAEGGIPGMARRVGNGFKTTGARAIVGEGKANYPEYVIPTDPTHRRRAWSLWADAGKKLNGRAGRKGITPHESGGVLGVPAYGLGGIIGDAIGTVGSWAKSGMDWVGDKVGAIVSTIFKPFYNAADKLVDKIDWRYAHDPAQYALDTAWRWVTSADRVYESRAKQLAPAGGNYHVNDPNNPRAVSIWKGGSFTNRFIAHLVAAQRLAKMDIPVTQGGFRPQTSYSGTSHQGDAIDTAASDAIIVALRRVGIAAGDRTGLGNWAPHTHAVPGPSAGYAAGSAVWQWQDYMARGGMNQSLSSPWGLRNGAIIKRRAGGVLARIGEGSRDEAVTPLPRNWSADSFGGKTEINIYGNLEFPNITSGEDAEVFIENLEILAKGA